MKVRLEPHVGGVKMNVKVVPGASRDRIVGVLGDALKVSVSKPPEGGAANGAVVKLLLEALDLPRGSVQIAAGHTNPRKVVLVSGVSVEMLSQKLAAALR